MLDKLRKDCVDLDMIHNQLHLITLFGMTLRSMVGGATMKKHLKVIAKFLPDRTALTKQPEVDHDRPREDEDVADADAEFHSFHLDAHDPALSKACNDWLELMVLHFDAV